MEHRNQFNEISQRSVNDLQNAGFVNGAAGLAQMMEFLLAQFEHMKMNAMILRICYGRTAREIRKISCIAQEQLFIVLRAVVRVELASETLITSQGAIPMRPIVLTLFVLLFACSASGEEFTTEAAKAAKAAYEADLQAAREKYQAALDEAAKSAVEAGKLDEVVRIKAEKEELAGTRTEDALTLARVQKALEGTKWTWTSSAKGRATSGLRLLPDQKIELGGVHAGAWQMVEPRTLLLRTNDSIYFLYFNADCNEYTKTLAFLPHKSNITPGKRTVPPSSIDLFTTTDDSGSPAQP